MRESKASPLSLQNSWYSSKYCSVCCWQAKFLSTQNKDENRNTLKKMSSEYYLPSLWGHCTEQAKHTPLIIEVDWDIFQLLCLHAKHILVFQSDWKWEKTNSKFKNLMGFFWESFCTWHAMIMDKAAIIKMFMNRKQAVLYLWCMDDKARWTNSFNWA